MRFYCTQMYYYAVLVFIRYETHGLNNNPFPQGFKLGVASSAYQVEGGIDERGVAALDVISRGPNPLANDGSNAEVTSDQYHHYKEDIQLLKDLNVDHYRISLSWPRILPTGFKDKINEAGVAYYKNLLEGLLSEGIEPIVTLFHWDTPESIEQLGGWYNERTVEYFLDYADICYELFGKYIKSWLTINEPYVYCAVQVKNSSDISNDLSGIMEYLCGHNLLKAHARAYHLYKEKYSQIHKGRVGIALNTFWFQPASNRSKDIEAAARSLLFQFDAFAHPLFIGGYPPAMIERIQEITTENNFSISRLPEFSNDEIEYIKNTVDYLGLNYYTTFLVEEEIGGPEVTRYVKDLGVKAFQPESWQNSASIWLKHTPWGLRNLLTYIKRKYNDPEIIITENGVSNLGDMHDYLRIKYLQGHFSACLDAIYIDKVNLTGYTYWSFLDSWEWWTGYTTRFGLYHVDFEDDQRKRTPRDSVNYFKKVCKTRCIVDGCQSDGPTAKALTSNKNKTVFSDALNEFIEYRCTQGEILNEEGVCINSCKNNASNFFIILLSIILYISINLST